MQNIGVAALLLLAPLSVAAQSDWRGAWVDDYGTAHRITDSTWQHGGSLYHIQRWDSAGKFLVAVNDTANGSDGGLWTRIDWVELSDMDPWQWGFCIAAWDAPTADSAAAVAVARRDTPRTGCNGFPFTRMRRAAG